jgi:phosphatidylglycerol:prolipoprotein diacylglycerol transferase
MIAYFVHHFSPFIVEFGGGIGVRWYGMAYATGFILGYFLYLWLARNGYSELSAAKVPDFITGICLWGVLLGGRIGYALFYDLPNLAHDPLRLLRVWEGGMASHGGILGIILFSFWYARRHRVSWTGLGDNLVVVAPIGIFFGRCANFINGELFGRITSVPWAVQFPKELYEDPALAERAALACITRVDPQLNSVDAIVSASEQSEPVRRVLSEILNPRHPSQLYEAGLEGAFLFLVLWLLRTRMRLPEGGVTAAFFIVYAAVRILGEEFRQPDAGVAFTLGLTRGQFLSVLTMAVGLAFAVLAWLRKKPSRFPAA